MSTAAADTARGLVFNVANNAANELGRQIQVDVLRTSYPLPDAEFEAILTRAAEEGAKRALADVGLDGDEAALDIRDLRSLVDCIRLVRRTAIQTAVRMITTGVMLALLAGTAIKLKIFGGSP